MQLTPDYVKDLKDIFGIKQNDNLNLNFNISLTETDDGKLILTLEHRQCGVQDKIQVYSTEDVAEAFHKWFIEYMG